MLERFLTNSGDDGYDGAADDEDVRRVRGRLGCRLSFVHSVNRVVYLSKNMFGNTTSLREVKYTFVSSHEKISSSFLIEIIERR